MSATPSTTKTTNIRPIGGRNWTARSGKTHHFFFSDACSNITAVGTKQCLPRTTAWWKTSPHHESRRKHNTFYILARKENKEEKMCKLKRNTK